MKQVDRTRSGTAELTPCAFLERAAFVFAGRTAVVDGDRRYSYAEFADRVRRLAAFLIDGGVMPGDRVGLLAPNTSTALEAHFGVPLAGAVLTALNTRLSGPELTYVIEHSAARLLLVDPEFEALARSVVSVGGGDGSVAIVVADDEFESALGAVAPAGRPAVPIGEWDLLSLNYTSGTTGRPKGVMYCHRGAYLQALAMVVHARLSPATRFLWTLPMFHCNGWCFPWAVTAAGGTHFCLRKVEPAEVWRTIRDESINAFNAAPTVLTSLAWHEDSGPVEHVIRVATGGSPPPPHLLARLDELGIEVTHLYGLTETYGPAAICDWQPEWDDEPMDRKAALRARQGVGNIVSRPLRVVDKNGTDVAADGAAVGEILVGGNNVMLGYYRDEEATAAVLDDGWFRTGDLAVMHPDGYVEIRDRLKDVIISGGENISSVEVEHALSSHVAVLECAVVGIPDERWGEVPVAFVVLHPGLSASDDELIEHVRARLARFKAPKRIIRSSLPRTATGKVQKFALRALATKETGSR